MNVSEFLERLDKVKRAGSGWTARCPAHEDRSPSLSISNGDTGGIVLHCHAGCATEDVVAALGLEMKDLAPEDPTRGNGSGGLGDEVAVYRYTDEDGSPLFEVVRYFPKTFRQRRADGSWGIKGVRRVLYRLPDVAGAVEEGRAVLLVEGEKDADRLAGLGFTATTCPGGAGKWRREYTDQLRGARVVITPDNDDPGREHAGAVAAELHEAGAEVRVLELPDLPAKGDVSDWLDGGGTEEELRELAKAAPVWTPGAADGLPSAVCALNPPPWEPPRDRIRGFMPDAEAALLAGEGGAMKTTMLLHMLLATAGGHPVFDHSTFLPERGPVLYIGEEDPEGVVQNRLEAMAKGHDWDRARTLGNFHYIAMKGTDLDDARWRNHVRAEVERLGAVLVGIDPLYEVTGAKETNDELKPVLRFWRELVRETGATVILVHHAGKAVEGRSKTDRIRGASALNQKSRCTWYLEATEDGVAFECLKMSREAKPEPFVVSPEIESDATNATVWTSARFSYMSRREATDDTAERRVLEVLEVAGPGQLNSTELKKAARDGANLSAADISGAITRLQQKGWIRYQEGARGAHLWEIAATLPQDRGKVDSTLPHLAGQGQTDSESPPAQPFPPLGGRAEGAGGSSSEGQGRQDEPDTCLNPDCSAPVGRHGIPCSECYRDGWREGEPGGPDAG